MKILTEIHTIEHVGWHESYKIPIKINRLDTRCVIEEMLWQFIDVVLTQINLLKMRFEALKCDIVQLD